MSPKRIQLKRVKGWRLPPGARSCARPTKYGNPFPLDGDWITWAAIGLGFRGDAAGRRAAAVALHEAWMTGATTVPETADTGGALTFSDGSTVTMGQHARALAMLATALYESPVLPEVPDVSELRGLDLGCYCALDAPCHVDTILRIANAGEFEVYPQ